ncbi:MAG: transposase [Dehalococcoidia bacterium]
MGCHSAAPPTSCPHGTTTRGRPADLDAILDVLITGCRWQDLPRDYGAPTTAWRRLTH